MTDQAPLAGAAILAAALAAVGGEPIERSPPKAPTLSPEPSPRDLERIARAQAKRARRALRHKEQP